MVGVGELLFPDMLQSVAGVRIHLKTAISALLVAKLIIVVRKRHASRIDQRQARCRGSGLILGNVSGGVPAVGIDGSVVAYFPGSSLISLANSDSIKWLKAVIN